MAFRPPERSRAQPAPRAPRAPRASSRSRSPAHCSVHPLQRARAAPRTAAHTSPRPAPPADGTRRSSRLSAPPRARERVSPPSPAPSPHPPAGAPPRCCAPRPWAHWHHHRVQPCTTPHVRPFSNAARAAAPSHPALLPLLTAPSRATVRASSQVDVADVFDDTYARYQQGTRSSSAAAGGPGKPCGEDRLDCRTAAGHRVRRRGLLAAAGHHAGQSQRTARRGAQRRTARPPALRPPAFQRTQHCPRLSAPRARDAWRPSCALA